MTETRPRPAGRLAPPPRAILTFILGMALALAYLATLAHAGGDLLARVLHPGDLHHSLLRCGGNLRELVLGGEPWRLLSAAFLHGGHLHLAVNLVGLVYLGVLTERHLGRSALLISFVVTALTGSAASILSSESLSVGASGALFGILGLLIIHVLRHRRAIPAAQRAMLLAGPILWVVANLALGLVTPDIDNAAHLGGFAGGLLLGLTPVAAPRSSAARGSRVVLAALCGALVTSALVAAFLATLQPVEAAASELIVRPVGGVRLHVPADWSPGVIRDHRCHADDAATEAECFIDRYGAVLIVVAAAPMALGTVGDDGVGTEQLGSEVRIFARGPRGRSYVVFADAELSERYLPLMRRLAEAADALPP